jgi:hypothetical protein
MYNGARVTFRGYPMQDNQVVEHITKDLAIIMVAYVPDVGEGVEINGNVYTVEKRMMQIETEARRGNSDILQEAKYGLLHNYIVLLEPRRAVGWL